MESIKDKDTPSQLDDELLVSKLEEVRALCAQLVPKTPEGILKESLRTIALNCRLVTGLRPARQRGLSSEEVRNIRRWSSSVSLIGTVITLELERYTKLGLPEEPVDKFPKF